MSKTATQSALARFCSQLDWCLVPWFMMAAVGSILLDRMDDIKPFMFGERPLFLNDATIAYRHEGDSIHFVAAPAVPLALFLPMLLVIELLWERRKVAGGWVDAAAAVARFIGSAMTAWATVLCMTCLLKFMGGRLRPDTLDRCRPVPLPGMDKEAWLAKGSVGNSGLLYGIDYTCSSSLDHSDIMDGFRSFPSGHSSMAMAVALYAALYILYSISSRPGWSNLVYGSGDRAAPRAACCSGLWRRMAMECAQFGLIVLCFMLLAWPFFVGATRFMGNHHNISDIVAGLLLGVAFTVPFFARAAVQHSFWQQRTASQADCRLPISQAQQAVPAGAQLELPPAVSKQVTWASIPLA